MNGGKTGKGLRAPFPWYGGKSRLADRILECLGDVTVYVEPFAGSLAVLLASDEHQREIVCDTDGALVNFWRSLAHDPEQVAHWADWPTFHDDLTARHRWLIDWTLHNGARLQDDPEYYDPKAAGWWVWGISSWIGGGWCVTDSDQRPYIDSGDNGQGVQKQRRDQRPHIKLSGGGQGVQKQRRDQRPHVDRTGSGRGVQKQRNSIPKISHTGGGDGVQKQRQTVSDLLPWFEALAARLERVVVLNRSWESAVTPTLLMDTPTSPSPPVGILMDPPYLTAERSNTLYGSDISGTSNDIARAAWAWSVDHGDRYRIAYCCHEGDFEPPDGWDVVTNTLRGIQKKERRSRRDCIMFSPACRPPANAGLLF